MFTIEMSAILHSFIVYCVIVDFLNFKNVVIESVEHRCFDTMVIIMCEYGDVSQFLVETDELSCSLVQKMSSYFPIGFAREWHYSNQLMWELMCLYVLN